MTLPIVVLVSIDSTDLWYRSCPVGACPCCVLYVSSLRLRVAVAVILLVDLTLSVRVPAYQVAISVSQPNVSAHITFANKEDTLACILATDG